MQTNIQPIQFFKESATVLKIETVQVRNLGEDGSAMILYTLCSSDGKRLSDGTLMLQGTNYSNWGSDDSYVLNFVLNELELTQG